MTCSPSLGWLCRSTSCASFPPRMRSQLQGSDLYPGGSTSHWIHQPSPGHTVRLLSPEPMVVKQPKFTRVEEPTLLCNQVLLSRFALARFARFGLISWCYSPVTANCPRLAVIIGARPTASC